MSLRSIISKLKTQNKKLSDYKLGDKLAFTKLSKNYGKIAEVIGFQEGKLVIGDCGAMITKEGSLELKALADPNSPLIEMV